MNCYNTGKIRIGIAYVPAPRKIQSADEYRLQSILFGEAQKGYKYIIIAALVVIVLSALPFI